MEGLPTAVGSNQTALMPPHCLWRGSLSSKSIHSSVHPSLNLLKVREKADRLQLVDGFLYCTVWVLVAVKYNEYDV